MQWRLNFNPKPKHTNGEIVKEFTYYLLGFVPADVVRLKNDVWFRTLSNEQIKSVEEFVRKNQITH